MVNTLARIDLAWGTAMQLAFLIRAGVVATALSLLALAALPARADEPPRIEISGTAELGVAPDRAMITSGVVSEAETAREALDLNSAALSRVIDTLKQADIADRDITTSGFSVSPQYRRDDRNSEHRIIGYQVSNQVTVRVRDLDRLGRVLDEVVSAGANRIDGIQFLVSDADRRLDEARAEAVRDARRKAEIYAEAGGVELGRILSMSESTNGGPPPRPLARTMDMEAAAAVPVETGEQTLRVRVDITWEIDQ